MTGDQPSDGPSDQTSDHASDHTADDLAVLCDQAVSFSSRLTGPLKRIAVRRGDVSVEVDWHEPVRLAVTDATAGAAPAASSHPGSGGPRLVRVSEESDTGLQGPQDDLHAIVAPLVGTFYRAPAPGEEPFVTVGSLVGVGQTIGIVEAMKLLNPITSDVQGRVVEILPADGQSVEFDQPLVRVAVEAATMADAKVG